MTRKFIVAMVILCLLCCGIITTSAETKNTEMFTIFDGITFSSPLESIEKHMEDISYQKVANYGLFGKYGFSAIMLWSLAKLPIRFGLIWKMEN